MSEELNLLREALRRVKYEAASLADAQVIALEALTQRPAEQAEPSRFGSPELQSLIVQHATQQATPEPVGEPFGYFRALPFGWEQCGEHDDGAVALYDRPAPGVPEDVQRDAERLDWLTFNISGKALRDIGVMWGEHANARAAIDAAMLAAAQAKGDDK